MWVSTSVWKITQTHFALVTLPSVCPIAPAVPNSVVRHAVLTSKYVGLESARGASACRGAALGGMQHNAAAAPPCDLPAPPAAPSEDEKAAADMADTFSRLCMSFRRPAAAKAHMLCSVSRRFAR